ncbi:hypothetical protein, partial [Candidatus Ichthyocystis sparus]|uniref:hypothetical protein n=1 Tax=Candidatus Ichthyocystis sparus TaxID=1561004 RepID=UPI001F5EF4CC
HYKRKNCKLIQFCSTSSALFYLLMVHCFVSVITQSKMTPDMYVAIGLLQSIFDLINYAVYTVYIYY